MAGRFVRASKYRHVYGQSSKKEQCYDNLRISRNAWDTNLVKANPEYISVNWEASGGGAFAVIPLNERGKLSERIPLFRGHTAAVLDTDWNPFDDNLLASGSDDGKVFLWRVPKGFTLQSDTDEPADISPVGRLSGHTRKVGHVLFNPAGQNVLASASGDFTVKIWDIEQGKDRLVLKHAEVVQSLSWSANGAYLVTTSRDKKLRFWDVRQEKPAQEVPGHAGAKNSRAVWMGEHDRVATTGFSRMSDRQLGLWDFRSPSEPIGGFQILDSISGVCMPFWDDGNKILYLAGKGDGNIRYFEYENDKFEYLSEYKSADPQRGLAFLPKRGVNVHENEVARAFKTVNDQYIEPISFIVPRRAEVFQTDIYPPTIGIKSAMTSGEWFEGKTAVPPMIDLKGKYEGGEADEVPAEASKSTSSPAVSKPAPIEEKPKPAPAPEPVKAVPPPAKTELKESKKAIEDMASKFADKEEDAAAESSDDSSFEEVSKPVERYPRSSAVRATAPISSSAAKPPPTVMSSGPGPVSGVAAATAAATLSSPPPAAGPSSSSTTGVTAAGAADGLKGHLGDIKSSQTAMASEITELKTQVKELTELVKQLAGRLDGLAGGQAERIRRVELELEGLRE